MKILKRILQYNFMMSWIVQESTGTCSLKIQIELMSRKYPILYTCFFFAAGLYFTKITWKHVEVKKTETYLHYNKAYKASDLFLWMTHTPHVMYAICSLLYNMYSISREYKNLCKKYILVRYLISMPNIVVKAQS